MIVIAEKEELELVEKLGFKDQPVLITGVGAINVIKALSKLPKDTPILNIGYCGSNNIEIGKTVGVCRVNTLHKTAQFNEDSLSCFLCGSAERYDEILPCYTSTDFVTKTHIKEPCVFDMELAYICSMFNFVMAIKVVSDNLSKKEYDKCKKSITSRKPKK